MKNYRKETNDNYIQSKNAYFSGGIDLIKWTVTIITASILWISTTRNQYPITIWLELALIFFVLSIIVAILIVIFVQLYWANQMNKYEAMSNIGNSKEFCKLYRIPDTLQKLDAIQNYKEASKQIQRQAFFHYPINYIFFIILHVAFLILGLVFLIGYTIN